MCIYCSLDDLLDDLLQNASVPAAVCDGDWLPMTHLLRSSIARALKCKCSPFSTTSLWEHYAARPPASWSNRQRWLCLNLSMPARAPGSDGGAAAPSVCTSLGWYRRNIWCLVAADEHAVEGMCRQLLWVCVPSVLPFICGTSVLGLKRTLGGDWIREWWHPAWFLSASGLCL